MRPYADGQTNETFATATTVFTKEGFRTEHGVYSNELHRSLLAPPFRVAMYFSAEFACAGTCAAVALAADSVKVGVSAVVGPGPWQSVR